MSVQKIIKCGGIAAIGFWSAALTGVQALPALPPHCLAQLRRDVDAIAHQPSFNQARLGIAIQPLDAAQPVYERDAQYYFLPASTTKVLTTAAALMRLGPQFRIQTDIYGAGQGSTLEHLRIVGHGDPSLSDQQLQQVAVQLQRQGVRRINSLLGDDTFFRRAGVVPSWAWEDIQAGYGAPANSLILNQNAYELQLWPQALGQPLLVEWLSPQPLGAWRQINRTRTVATDAPEYVEIRRWLHGSTLEIELTGQLRVGADPDRSAVAVINPGWFLLNRLQAILAQHQIKVAQISLLDNDHDLSAALKSSQPERRLTQIQSPPLSALITTTNQQSNNLYAEALLRTLGTMIAPQNPQKTTHQQGLDVLKQTLTQLGVEATTYALADGSGLSRHNLISPSALVQTFQAMLRSPHSAIFQASLPQEQVGKGQNVSTLFSKSGSMQGVSTLSGYLQQSPSPPLIFSLMFNQYNQSSSQRRQAMDALLLSMNRLQSCQSGKQ
ncbi:MAG: D-alanyl-D-alanine carboxypeptidase/D-alanyl-D-alanine-endopeptidase [Acaryochloris sp. SU_5_25]|nr:D-alanyl-D-alanine carboxypeptidase/D-alanyl-D-alanine-endopeptidase [Acaryochloris sp. SU_5_25]